MKFPLLLATLLLAAPVARAQMSPDLIMETYNSNIQVITNGIINKDMMDKTVRNYNARGGSRGAAATTSSRATATRTSLAYVPTAALKQQTVQQMSRKLQASNPAAAQAFNGALGPGKTDYGQLFGELVKTSGLPVNNAATALAAYLEVGYVIVNDVQDTNRITPAMDQGLQRQAANILSANKNLTSPAAVAKLGEEMKLQTVLLYLGWQGVRKSGQLSEFRSGIAQQFRQNGLDMSSLQLTTQGLVKK